MTPCMTSFYKIKSMPSNNITIIFVNTAVLVKLHNCFVYFIQKINPWKMVFLAPAVTVGETGGAMDSASVFFLLFFCL